MGLDRLRPGEPHAEVDGMTVLGRVVLCGCWYVVVGAAFLVLDLYT